ncbi:GNAT family N-acetyltransferase [Bacillus timonensis]|nr:GNAT family N-acetyltransferase [Bacillus timonensis]
MNTNEVTTIHLSFYKPEHEKALLQFHLPDELKKFTALPSEVLQLSIEDKNRYPIVILNGDTPVGFFVLHHGPDIQKHSMNGKAILLRAFLIDQKHHGKGYAKKGMEALPSFVKENLPAFNEVVLAVNFQNPVAKRLYEKAGFVDNGGRLEGRIGMQYILHLALDK